MDNDDINGNIVDFTKKKLEKEEEQFYQDVSDHLDNTVDFANDLALLYEAYFEEPCSLYLDQISDPDYVLIFIRK